MSVVYGAFDSRVEALVVAFLITRPQYQQFGQSHDDAVWNGGSACTHTVWQIITRIVTGTHYTLNEINSLAGLPRNPLANGVKRGMRPEEVQRLIDRLHLPYEIVFDKPWSFLRARAKWGPVMYAMRYGSAPTWRGYRYNGHAATAPFALKCGATQLSGFENGRHAVLLAGVRRVKINGKAGTVAYRKDPNHGTEARPERPFYDIITTAQSSAEYTAYRDRLGGRLYAAVPTKAIPTTHLL